MTPEQKQDEFQLMENSDKRTIKVEIPNGPSLVCNHSWDYRTNLSETSFKTGAEVTVKHELLKVEELNLLPYSAKMVYKITILRRPESNLKNEQRPKTRR